jgi:DNA-binding transcriptional LysR family regulator
MNLEQLEAIRAVVEKGSFRAAAEHLRRSQPALSATIKNLEDEFGFLLFDRSAYRPTLTEVGAVFLNVANSTLDAAHYAQRVAIELGQHKAETKLHIAVDPLASIESIEILVQECARPVLPVNLILEKSILEGSYQEILDGKIDLAIAPSRGNEKNIEKIVLQTVTLVGVVSRKLLQEKRTATKSFLEKNPQILVYDKQPSTISEGGHKIFVPDHFTKLSLIDAGVGWGRISKDEYDNGKDFVLIDKSLCTHVSMELCLIRAKNRPIGRTGRMIWKAFEEKVQKRVRSKIK